MFIIDFAHFLLQTAGGGMNSVGGGGKIFERLKGERCEGSGVVLSGVFGNWKSGSISGISGWNFGSISVSGSSLGSSSGIVGKCGNWVFDLGWGCFGSSLIMALPITVSVVAVD